MNSSPDAVPAYVLWVELATRISTQRLHYRAGDEETAAASVRSLFKTVRELTEKNPEAAEFRTLGMALLNQTLRPYTSRWHGWMTQSQERTDKDGNPIARFRDEQVRRMFRDELQQLRLHLQRYQAALAKLAGIQDYRPGDRDAKASLGGDLVAQIVDQVSLAVPKEGQEDGRIRSWETIIRAEQVEILARREISRRVEGSAPEVGAGLVNATGLALSGGGIRSATFCLGIVQVLAKRKLIPQFDYLSTVSGGGYLGSFLSCALGTSDRAEGEVGPAETAQTIAGRIDDIFHRNESKIESGVIRHLRNNSKYLLNGGIKTRLEIAGLILSGILYNFLMVLPLALGSILILYGLNGCGFWGGAMSYSVSAWPTGSSASGILLAVCSILLAGAWLLLPGIQLATHGQAPRSFGAIFRRRWEWGTIGLWAATILAVILYLLPSVFHGYENVRQTLTQTGWRWIPKLPEWVVAAGGGIGAALLGLVSTWIKPHWVGLQKVLVRLFILSGPLWFGFIALLVGNRLGLARTEEPILHPGWVIGVTLFLGLWGWFLVNINTLAPHRYYRSKLCECYLVRRTNPEKSDTEKRRQAAAGEPAQGRTESLQQVKLTSLNAFPAAPYHLINTTLNLPSSSNKELRGRNGDFFLVSKHFCGAPTVGYLPTSNVEQTDPHFDLGTAMAVSGAAASTNMGWKSLPHFRFLMTLFNVRLGYWLRRPGEAARHPWLEGVGPWYLYREMAGSISEECRYVNLSDGGHIENLAAYELLRRRCKFIVCVDGGQEPGMECSDLIRLQRYAEIDLGIRMHYDVSELHLQPNGMSQAYGILVKINYSPELEEASPDLGWLLYLKLAVTGTEPLYVGDYRRENSSFPHETTGDQFFGEAQFEAYRMLGEEAAESLFRKEIIEGEPPVTLRAWFQQLADKLLPDNDPVFTADETAAGRSIPGSRGA